MIRATNSLIKDLKKQKRENGSLLFLDNFKIIKDAIAGGLIPKLILLEEESKNIYEGLCPVYKVDRTTIEQLADSKTPQGVVCILEYIQNVAKEPTDNFLVMDRLQDPGNVGTLIRSACASGFNEIYLVDSVNPTNSKVVRSSVGTIFKTNIYSLSSKEFVKLAKKWGLNLLVADMDGENIFTFKPNSKIGLVVGNEGQGVSEEITSICSHKVKIPMKEGVESLNAGVSGSIIMYEIAKNTLL